MSSGERSPSSSRLEDRTRANRDFLLTRPWLLGLDQHTPPLGPRTLRWLDRALAGTALSHSESITIATTLTGYASRQAAPTAAGTGDGPVGGLVEYGAVLDPGEYPALTEAVRQNAFGAAEEWIDDADFTFGLGLLLDGIETLIAAKSR